MKYQFLVTCATGDIGSALCFHLAKKGHDLIITARDIEKLKALSASIKAKYPDTKVSCFSADLGQPVTSLELLNYAKKVGIDGIVLMPPRPPLLSTNPILQFNELNQAFQDCVTGPRLLLQQLLPAMNTSTLKSVVLVSGTSSKQPIAGQKYEAFNDIRNAWVGCAKSFADTYADQGIRFNTISPGQVLTPSFEKQLQSQARARSTLFTQALEEQTKHIPLDKLASLEGVIKTIYFFLKSKGAREITATNTLIDGGASRSYS